MILQSLTGEKITVLTKTFNQAFADYLVKIALTEELLTTKIKQESINLEWSVGVYDKDVLAGFILHGYRDLPEGKFLYNGGTGVLPSYRGQKLTSKMYQYLFPLAKKNKIKEISLEVIRENEKAYAVYQKNGFQNHRELICFSGPIPKEKNTPSGIEIRKLDFFPTIDQTWWNNLPSWPASCSSLKQIKNDLLMAGAFFENNMVGYILALQSTGRIFQLCVNPEHRRKGIARLLLHECIDPKKYPSVLALNVDARDIVSCNFFKSIGWKESVIQFELIKNLID